jgi:hypothetical protein
MAKTRKHLMRKSRTRRLHKRRVSRGGGGGSSKPAAAPAPASASRANREAAREERKAAREAATITRRAEREAVTIARDAARQARKTRRNAAFATYKAEAEKACEAEGIATMRSTLRSFADAIRADPSKKEEFKQAAIAAGNLQKQLCMAQKVASFVFVNSGNNDVMEELEELGNLNFEAVASGP